MEEGTNSEVSTESAVEGNLDYLNEKQRLAVTQTSGPMLILAGAGSGKTRTITHKIAFLIGERICEPNQILAVTFTNKAAQEMRDRVEKQLIQPDSSPLICTFHSFSARLLRRHADLVGYGRDFTICDTDDQKRVFKTVYDELHLTNSDISMNGARRSVSRAKSRNWSSGDLAEHFRGQGDEIVRIYEAYQRFLKRSNAVDFDDLLLLTVQLLNENSAVREHYGAQYHYLLIDEYQDTNRPQYDLIKNLTSVHKNITAVGDEDQSIYGFRGADIGNILRFEEDFPGARIVKLEQNYRSSQNILDAATAVVSNNVDRKGKVLWTERPEGDPIHIYPASDARAEAYFVCGRIHEHLQDGERNLAVLYRTNFQSRQFEEALGRFQISYKLIGGVSFYHRKEIKDALAYLRVALNPDDNVSLQRIINVPARGIGVTTMKRLHRDARTNHETLWRTLCSGIQENRFPARTHLALERFFELIHQCQTFLNIPLYKTLQKILDTCGYIDVLRREDSEEAHNRILNLDELVTVAKEYEEQGLDVREFLDQATLRSEADDYDESAPVSLMTLHNAKGLEFSVVFLVGCEEGLFPHSRSVGEDAMEEERRLCYVGLTRGQKRIYLTFSRRRRFFGRETDEVNIPSRFLGEIPDHLVQFQAPKSGQAVQSEKRQRGRGKKSYAGKTYDSVGSVSAFLDQLSESGKTSAGGFVLGARIVHKQFGYGRILNVQDMGNDLKITVQFSGLGIKKLLQSYAKLKLV